MPLRKEYYAYCSGPHQVVHLLGALEALGLEPERCIVALYARGLNDAIGPATEALCRQIGLRVCRPDTLPRLSDVQGFGERLRRRMRRVRRTLLFHRATSPCKPQLLDCLLRTQPDEVIEYYDGFETYHLLRVAGTGSLLSRAARKRPPFFLRRLLDAWTTPALFYLPDDPIWKDYVPPELTARVRLVAAPTAARGYLRVGAALERLQTRNDAPPAEADVVVLANVYSKRLCGVSAESELRMYGDLFRAVRAAWPGVRIGVKTHPRISSEMSQALRALCEAHEVSLDARQQLVEYPLLRARRAAVLIGGPSTAFLTCRWLRCAGALCASFAFMRSYLGEGYNELHHFHSVMARGGVREFDGVDELQAQLPLERASPLRGTDP